MAGQTSFDAFISYRRTAKIMAFVDRLQMALAGRGKNVWLDRARIEPAADWSQRIARGIAAAKAFIFVITPESVASQECLHELETAVQQNKLIVPVVLRNLDNRQSTPELPSRLNWITFGTGRDYERAGPVTAMAMTKQEWTCETVRVRWGVMDDHGQVAECPSEHDAREYQAQHGGEVVTRTTTRYTFRRPSCRS